MMRLMFHSLSVNALLLTASGMEQQEAFQGRLVHTELLGGAGAGGAAQPFAPSAQWRCLFRIGGMDVQHIAGEAEAVG